MSTRRTSLTILLAMFFLSGPIGCVPRNNGEDFAGIVGAPIGHVVDIRSMAGSNVERGTSIPLFIKNVTNDCIVFPYDFGIRPMILNDGAWKTIADRGHFSAKRDNVLSAAGTMDDNGLAFVNPDYSVVPASAGPITMRIVVMGRRCQNGIPAQAEVADYIDLSILP